MDDASSRAALQRLFMSRLAHDEIGTLLDKWLAILEAFTRFKNGRLRHAEFDGYMLPWRTSLALKCFASNTLYPHFLPTPDGLRLKDLWLYDYQPFKRILQDVKEELDRLPGDKLFPDEVMSYLAAKTGLTISIVND